MKINYWTDEEIALLKEHYIKSSDTTMRSLFPNRNAGSIRHKAEKLGLKRYRTLEERFLEKINKDSQKWFENTQCWEWTGHTTYGYGYIRYNETSNQKLRAHRVAYVLFVGPIPDDMTIHHKCYNRKCVNPLHLACMSIKDNVLDSNGITAVNKRKTHCPRNHEYIKENIYLYKNQRHCIQCAKEKYLEKCQ